VPGPAPACEPAALSPMERIAEIFEALFLKEPELTAELLQDLGKCAPAGYFIGTAMVERTHECP
jgi:hypothetical protein